jgi:hypothetical protein
MVLVPTNLCSMQMLGHGSLEMQYQPAVCITLCSGFSSFRYAPRFHLRPIEHDSTLLFSGEKGPWCPAGSSFTEVEQADASTAAVQEAPLPDTAEEPEDEELQNTLRVVSASNDVATYW